MLGIDKDASFSEILNATLKYKAVSTDGDDKLKTLVLSMILNNI